MSALEQPVTIAEFCAAAGISIATYYRLREAGTLPIREFRLGRSVRLPRRDVEAYLRAGHTSATVFSPRYFDRVRRKKEERAQRNAG